MLNFELFSPSGLDLIGLDGSKMNKNKKRHVFKIKTNGKNKRDQRDQRDQLPDIPDQAPVVQNLAMWVSILSLWVLIKFKF